MSPRARGRRLLERARRNRWGANDRLPADGSSRPLPSPPEPPPESTTHGVGWDHTITHQARPSSTAGLGTEELRAQLLSLLADPRTPSITTTSAASTLGIPHSDVEITLDAMTQAGELQRVEGLPHRYQVPDEHKAHLEALFRQSAAELGEHGILMVPPHPDDALLPLDDDAEEPRLPITAGLLSMFLPGTGQLLNGDVGRASLVFAVWSLAWITQLSPVWTFVCLYAGAEAFFTAKIRSMERKLAQETAHGTRAIAPTNGQFPPKPSST